MKTKTKQTAKKYGRTKPTSAPSRKRSEDRGLNSDEQNRTTNVAEDLETDESVNITLPVEDDLEQEEEREKKRRVEDARGEEEN